MKNVILVALLVIVSTIASHAQYVKSRVISVTGDATVTTPGGTTTTLAPGQTVSSGSVISTSGGSSVIISPFPGSSYQVKPNSSITVGKVIYKTSGSTVLKRSSEMRLTKGYVFFNVNPGHEAITDFRVHAGSAVAAARGCTDLIGLGDDGTVTADSVTGTLTFSNASGSTTLSGGNFSSVTPGGTPTTPAPITPAQMNEITASVNAMITANTITPAEAALLVTVLNANGITIPPNLQTLANSNPATTTVPTTATLNQSNETKQ